LGEWQPIRGADQTSVDLKEEASDAEHRAERAAGVGHLGLRLDQRAGVGAGQSKSVQGALRRQSGRAGQGFHRASPSAGRAVGTASAPERPAFWEFRASRARRHSPGPRESQALEARQVEEERELLLLREAAARAEAPRSSEEPVERRVN